MKRFLLKISIFLVAVTLWYAILGTFADGNTDNNYNHFAYPKAQNMILGDSRGAQGVIPQILNKEFKNKKFDNFALNIVNSPYGKVYRKGIEKKIDQSTKEGIFILTVNPWNLSASKGITDFNNLPESTSPLVNMNLYDVHPNYEYLIKNYHKSWYYLYRDRDEVGKSNAYLNKNGWLEVTVDMDSLEVAKRTKEKVKDYLSKSESQELSDFRINNFKKIITFLQKHGNVYIVRIPASKGIMDIEFKKYPNFNLKMKEISSEFHVPYFDFSQKYMDYRYTDGNHIYKEFGKIFTQQIADSIKNK